MSRRHKKFCRTLVFRPSFIQTSSCYKVYTSVGLPAITLLRAFFGALLRLYSALVVRPSFIQTSSCYKVYPSVGLSTITLLLCILWSPPPAVFRLVHMLGFPLHVPFVRPSIPPPR